MHARTGLVVGEHEADEDNHIVNIPPPNTKRR